MGTSTTHATSLNIDLKLLKSRLTKGKKIQFLIYFATIRMPKVLNTIKHPALNIQNNLTFEFILFSDVDERV